MSKFSIHLKELRKKKDLSSRALAKVLDLSDRSIQRWERDECIPNANAIIMLAQFFEVTTDYLLGLQD